MRGDEARELLGFPSDTPLTPSQVKAAYRKKAWETHPDRFAAAHKVDAESRFKLISEAYESLQAGAGSRNNVGETYVRVVRRGVPRTNRKNSALIKVPFLLIIFGTISLGGLNASRAYRRQKEENPSISRNPFLP